MDEFSYETLWLSMNENTFHPSCAYNLLFMLMGNIVVILTWDIFSRRKFPPKQKRFKVCVSNLLKKAMRSLATNKHNEPNGVQFEKQNVLLFCWFFSRFYNFVENTKFVYFLFEIKKNLLLILSFFFFSCFVVDKLINTILELMLFSYVCVCVCGKKIISMLRM